MTVLNLQVNVGANDGDILGSGNFNNSRAYLWFGRDSSFGQPLNLFIRFTNVTVPKNAVINSSTLTFRCHSTTTNTVVNALIDAHAADNPSAPATAAGVTSAPRTSAKVSWSNVPAWTADNDYTTPSVASITQELVNRTGWSSGNAMVWFVNENGSSNPNRIRMPYSYNGSTAGAPKLTIDYTPPNTAPTITVNPSVNYNGYTRLGPSNTPGTISFTATDPEETGSNALSYQIRTASGSGGTLVASGNFTSGVAANVNIAHNASGLSEGSNTLYLRVSDGTDFAPTNPSFALLVDRTAPTLDGDIEYDPDPVTGGS